MWYNRSGYLEGWRTEGVAGFEWIRLSRNLVVVDMEQRFGQLVEYPLFRHTQVIGKVSLES